MARPVEGAKKVANLVMGFFRNRHRVPDLRLEATNCNHAPAVLVYTGDHLEAVVLLEIVDGAITNLYATRNPDKLAAVAAPRTITR